MLPRVVVKELSVSIHSSDDSYMPKNFTVTVGDSEGSLREVKKVFVPRETTGRFYLMKNLAKEYRVIQINIKGCHNDGCDVRIRGLHIKGYKYVVGGVCGKRGVDGKSEKACVERRRSDEGKMERKREDRM